MNRGGGVNQSLSQRTESWVWKSSRLMWIGEQDMGEFLCLGVLQCKSTVLGTEKETLKPATLASSVSKSF